jgi:alkanesulfonate monooxygenase SsuD/methylene tetrahydromethanopterin reductase-like flavin-dependent oxidoreductase (luciferase family)
LDESHPLYGLRTSPSPSQPADLFLLGTTTVSAALAASLGMPYVFALFLNSDEQMMAEAVDIYQSQFDTMKGLQPQTLLALPVMVAGTDEAAQHDAAELKVVRLRLASGRTFTIGTLEAAEDFGKQSGSKATLLVRATQKSFCSSHSCTMSNQQGWASR